MSDVLTITGLDKHFGALHVTRNVSLTLRAGECHALIGPNGAGKSTLVHQVSGALAPDAGTVAMGDEDMTALSTVARARLGLGRSFQITSVIASFTALENVALAVQARRVSSFRFFRRAASESALNERAMACLARFGLIDRADAPAGAMSHGERRLLELAIALAGEPRLLLLDEPMAGMGRGESADLTAVLAALKRDIPILLVEHDMDAVFALADRVSLLVDGAIVSSGTPAEVRADPTARSAYLGQETS